MTNKNRKGEAGAKGNTKEVSPGMGEGEFPGRQREVPDARTLQERALAAVAQAADLTEAQRKDREHKISNLTAMGQGRPKGVQNKLTRHMKECIEEAFEKAGGVEYLVRIANGNTADRTAFMALLGRLLPMQVNSNIDQRIRVELPWLAQRTIGKTAASDAALLANAGKAAAEGRIIDGDPPEGGE